MRRVFTLIVAGVLAAVTAWGLVWYRRTLSTAVPVSGMFPNGMAYARLGTGPKTLLYIRGGPGNTAPTGRLLLVVFAATLLGPFLHEGYSIWVVTRKRDMPRGYTVADMAEDYAELIADEFAGRVDLVIGEGAYGGMIGYWLTARQPDRLGHLVTQLTGYRLSEPGRAMELDYARLVSEGRMLEATTLAARFLLPGAPVLVARIVGAIQMALFIGKTHPYFASDVLVEAEAVAVADAREVLSDIRVPVLVIGCDRDLEFPREVYEETARLIPEGNLRLLEGKTVLQVSSDRRFALDVLDFVRRTPGTQHQDAASRGAIGPALAGS